MFSLLMALAVAGIANAQNKVVVVPLGGDEAKLVTKRVTKNYPAGQFVSAFNDERFFRNTGQTAGFTNNSPTAALGISTSLDLPQGAILRSLTCYVDDQESSFDFGFSSSAEIERRARNSTVTEDVLMSDLIMTTSGDSAGLTSRTTSSFAYAEIDNESYFYTLYVFFQAATSAGGFVSTPFNAPDMDFYGCSLEYDIEAVEVM